MTTLIRHPDVVAREVGKELVLVHLGRNEIFTTNPAGARIWELLGENVAEADLVPRLLAEFETSDVEAVSQEVDVFLRMLRAEGLVIDAEA